MRLVNEVILPAPAEEIFALLGDVERVAPCLPGTVLEGRDSDGAYRGRVKIKVGPISASYSGSVRFMESDPQAGRLVLNAKGIDQHGSGNAEAKATVQVRPHHTGSVLMLDTDLVIRGKVAQFGRGALRDVSQQMMEQFAGNMAGLLVSDRVAPAPTVAAAPQPATGEAGWDALSPVVWPLVKRFMPVAGALLVGLVVKRLADRAAGRVSADDRMTATMRTGPEEYVVPVRRTPRLTLRRR